MPRAFSQSAFLLSNRVPRRDRIFLANGRGVAMQKLSGFDRCHAARLVALFDGDISSRRWNNWKGKVTWLCVCVCKFRVAFFSYERRDLGYVK